MARTRVYVDVDGVINAFPGSPLPETWEDWDQKIVLGYMITYSPQLLRALEELAELPDVEMVWLTTWQKHAVVDLCPALGLDGDKWRVIDTRDNYPGRWDTNTNWWKRRELYKDLASSPVDRVVWLDDDHNAYGVKLEHLEDDIEGTKFHVVTPITHMGLTPEHVRGIIEFVTETPEELVD